MKLGTHQERMAALESALDSAQNGMEKAAIIETAARMDRDNEYVQRSGFNAGQADCAQSQTH